MKAQVMRLMLTLLVLICSVSRAQAGLILYSDRAAFESAAGASLAFEGFNDNTSSLVELSTDAGFNPYRTTTSHVSEGDMAISVFERDTLTVNFDHEVFALGFDVNELNASNLTYLDSAGHEILDALQITSIWNASTFFGVISDTAITSFSLIGSGPDSLRATYGFDALSFSQPAISVPAPQSVFLIVTGLFILASLTRTNRKSALL